MAYSINPNFNVDLYNILDFDDIIESFKNTLEEFDVDLSIFYKNIESLDITIELGSNEEYFASYGVTSNTLFLNYDQVLNYKSSYYNSDVKLAIIDFFNHELLHLASSKITNDYYSTGFKFLSRVDDSIDIGNALNEGITDLLVNIFFTNHTQNVIRYSIEKIYAMRIAEIIGFDKIIKYYFDSSLEGLIQEMSKYTDRDSAIDFIKTLDIINSMDIYTADHSKKRNYGDFIYYSSNYVLEVGEEYKDFYLALINNCNDYLYTLFHNKLNKDLTPHRKKKKLLSDYYKSFDEIETMLYDEPLSFKPSFKVLIPSNKKAKKKLLVRNY